MAKKYFNLQYQIIALSILAIYGLSCGGDQSSKNSNDIATIENEGASDNELLEIDGKVFSIPSPIQTAFLIKNSGTNYNKDILNTPSKVTNYSNSFKKALNLGVYGADLGYVTLYEQTNDAISFLTAIKTLGDDLGISSTFDQELIQRFEKNIGNQDSLLALVSDAFKASDRYLKNNQQNDIGGLILAGGWIESLYFATNTAEMTSNEAIIKRIGEQKTTIYNLTKLLLPYYGQPEFATLIDDLLELDELFAKVKSTYTYVEPTTDEANKTTTINSTSEVKITNEQVTAISQKVMQIRIGIIN